MPATTLLTSKRSFTGNHNLLPAHGRRSPKIALSDVPSFSLITWTLGRRSVIWRIWPAVTLHTVFAAIIVTVSLKTRYQLGFPSVLLTVLGVVIGFVISYRAMSGYDRYFMGRTAWSDMCRNARTLGRLIWFHVPPRLTPKTPEEIISGPSRSRREMKKVMSEKRQALDLIEGFCVAVKHHIRGELGLYYEDLYPLIRPLHDHAHDSTPPESETDEPTITSPQISNTLEEAALAHHSRSNIHISHDPIIPNINEYGTFKPTRRSRSNSSSSSSSSNSSLRGLLPASMPMTGSGIFSKIAGDLVPFGSFFSAFKRTFWPTKQTANTFVVENNANGHINTHQLTHEKHRPLIAGGLSGQNVPLQVLNCLSEWCSVLEDRGTVPGTSMGPMMGSLAAFEDSLGTLEKILTTPLPFVYSVHISTVWLYLFFMPFQLLSNFEWFTIPGVGLASFIYLGFLAAGEEIEQPFGYDENDLDLDLLCRSLIRPDLARLKSTPCLNAYMGPSKKGKSRQKERPTLVEESDEEYEHSGNGQD